MPAAMLEGLKDLGENRHVADDIAAITVSSATVDCGRHGGTLGLDRGAQINSPNAGGDPFEGKDRMPIARAKAIVDLSQPNLDSSNSEFGKNVEKARNLRHVHAHGAGRAAVIISDGSRAI
jgi:hypothetical protein